MIRLDAKLYPIAAVHPWVEKCDTTERWKLWRAIRDEFEDAKTKRDFLPKSKMEQEANYEVRVALTEFLGFSPQAIEQIVGAVFGSDPVFETEVEEVKDWLGDADGCGTPFVEIMETASAEAAGMGISYVRVEGPSKAIGAASRAVEIDAGAARPFADVLRAEDVINWATDQDGALLWAVVIQFVHDQTSPLAERTYNYELSFYDRQSVARYRLAADAGGAPISGAAFVEVPIENPVHGLGVVPIFPIYGVRIGHMMGDPLIRGAARADRAAFNQESWLAVAMYRHANPILKLTTSREIDTIMSGAVARIMPGEVLEYTETPEAAFDARRSQIERLNRYASMSAGMNPRSTADAANTAKAQSGIAMKVEFTQTQQKAIARHARNNQRTARAVIEAAEKYITNKAESSLSRVVFKSTFDTQDAREMLGNLATCQLSIESPTLHRELAKIAASKLVGDLGVETMAKIHAEIDSAQSTVPDAPTDDRA